MTRTNRLINACVFFTALILILSIVLNREFHAAAQQTDEGEDIGSITCTDSDVTKDVTHGRNQWLRGEIHMEYADGTDQYDRDECEDGKTLIEYYCNGREGWNEHVICFHSCSEGACQRSATSQNPVSTPSAGFEDEVNKANPFPDVDPLTPEGEAAVKLRNLSIIGGFPDGEFKGWRLVNRAEASKFLLNSIQAEVDENSRSSTFGDVIEGEWYVPFVNRAAELNIIKGDDGKNTFRPGDGVNTAEFLAMLVRAFDLPHSLNHEYTDVNSADWFNAYAGIAWHYGLFLDRGSSLQPAKALSRFEVALALSTIMDDPYKLDRLETSGPTDETSDPTPPLDLDSGSLPDARVIAIATVPSSMSNWNPVFWIPHPTYDELAYVDASPEGDVLVHGDKRGKSYDRIDWEKMTLPYDIVFSPDGRKIAFIAQECTGSTCEQFAVLDDAEGKRFDSVSDLTFSGDSRHLAYLAKKGGKQFAVVDGTEGKSYDSVSEILVGDDGSVAYRAEAGEEEFVVQDGVEGTHYTNAWLPTTAILPDGRLVYEVRTPVDDFKKMKSFFVIGGVEEPRFGALGKFFVNSDGTQTSYQARRSFGSEYHTVMGERQLNEYSSARFGPSGAIAYVAYLPGGEGVLFNGKTSPAFSGVEQIVFSSDGKHVANVSTSSDTVRHLMLDGNIIAEYKHYAWDPVFSPDSKTLAYRAGDENGMSVFINKERGGTYEFVWEPFFSPDGSTVIYGAYDGEKFLKVEQPVR